MKLIDFKIIIEEYNPTLARFIVSFIPNDKRCLPTSMGVACYREDMTEEEILRAIKISAPQEMWRHQIELHEKDHSVFKSLVNREFSSIDIELTDDHIDEYRIQTIEATTPPKSISEEVDEFILSILNEQPK
jgi:hypothetical protein